MNNINDVKNFLMSIGVYTNRQNAKITKENCNRYDEYIQLEKYNTNNTDYIQSPDVIFNRKYGSCFDQTILAKKLFDEIGIENKLIFSHIDTLKDIDFYQDKFIDHLAIMYKENNMWKWIDWSWTRYSYNNLEYENFDDLLKKYKEIAENSWHYPVIVRDVTNYIEYNIPRIELFRKFLNIEKYNI